MMIKLHTSRTGVQFFGYPNKKIFLQVAFLACGILLFDKHSQVTSFQMLYQHSDGILNVRCEGSWVYMSAYVVVDIMQKRTNSKI